MSNKPIPASKRFQWRLECLVHSLIETLARLLPGAWVFRLGEAFAGVVWYFMPRRRILVLRNLRIAFGHEKSLPELKQMAKECFRRAGGNLISGAHTSNLPPSELNEVLKVENIELIEKPVKEGKGVVLLVSHMGNWELLNRLVHVFPEGSRIAAFYRPLNNELMNERVLKRRQVDGNRMFSKRDPFHQVTGFLRGGGIVGVLADQRVGGNGDLIQFFGRLTRASPLPSLLARRAKCEVIALSLTTESPGRWKATLLPVEKPHSTKHCMSALEAAMKRGPTDVFWLQERWRVRFRKTKNITDLLEDERSEANKSHRALVWLVGVDDSWRMPAVWAHPDVTYEAVIERGRPLPSWLSKDTRVHEVEREMSLRDYQKVIQKIDQLEVLPVDYLLSENQDGRLLKACKSLSVPRFVAS